MNLCNLNFSKTFQKLFMKHVVLWTDFVIFSLSVLPFIFEYIISHVLTTLSKWKWVWYWVYNFLVIWLWFKAENICDIWMLMYNLLHFPFKGFYSLVVKNPNLLFTTFTCLFLILNDSWMKIVCAHQPLHNLLSFLATVLRQNHVTFYITVF